MDVTTRLEESIKQVRLAKQDVTDPEVVRELEETLESLRSTLESLEENNET
ncbi:hypothetical protein [Haloarcula brevis]|uniref:hypothetical protein n=1 Tax=Haloarcula brevis TaxID=3111453 RepID=UPI00300EE7AB